MVFLLKNKRIFLVFFLSLIIFFALYVIKEFALPHSIRDLLNTDYNNVTKVLMRSGHTGKFVVTNDSKKIMELISLLDNRKYYKSFDQIPRLGYTYYYYFYVEENKILTIVGTGNFVRINQTYYNLAKDISTDEVTQWFNSLPIQEN